MANRFVLNETSYHGKGAIAEIANEIKARAFKNALSIKVSPVSSTSMSIPISDWLITLWG